MKSRVLAFALSLACLATAARAQWARDGAAVCTAADQQFATKIVSDGAGGAIMVWHDLRSGTNYDIHAQRVNAAGATMWTTNGVAVCTAVGNQDTPELIPDGAGGAIITWHDTRGGAQTDIYAQRINAAGVPQWTANGVAVCTSVNEQSFPTIVADAAGGAIITWRDNRSGPHYDIFSQRINSSGVVQWTANGVALCTAINPQFNPQTTTDGVGGVIATWHDNRSGSGDIYAQRVNAAGAVQWLADGIPVCTTPQYQDIPNLQSDGSGGAIIVWRDQRNGNYDIYAQRINAVGVPQWVTDGVVVCNAADQQLVNATKCSMLGDGAGGSILAWHDRRSGLHHIYAQRINANGSAMWPANGLAVCTAANEQGFPTLVPDGSGGVVIAWHDGRNGPTTDLYAQRVNALGVALWSYDGVALCSAVGNQFYPAIAADNAGGALIAWNEQRNGNDDVFAQRLEFRYGLWGHPEPTIVSVADIPADQGGKVKVNWRASDHDANGTQYITHYSVWRATDAAAALAAESNGLVLRSPSDLPRGFRGTAIWKQRQPNADYYWEWVGDQDAHYRAAYTFSAPTRSDSTAAGTANAYFFVSAHTYDPFVYFDSNVASGHSVDNLAPAAPLFLTAQRVGNDVQLNWNHVRVSDLRDYSVYRAGAPGVTPVPLNFVAGEDDTLMIDANVPPTQLYYIVTAIDIHGNQSNPSNEASALTGIGDTPTLTALTVMQNHPNPFTGSTDLSIGLPRESDVSIEIFDVAGRRVRTQSMSRQSAGWNRIAFDGRSDAGRPLASGVYFYRVTAAGSTVTRKMVIAR